jgi:P4 family phage/plasmid primase-like protien
VDVSSHLLGFEHAINLASRGWKVVPYLDRPGGSQMPGWNTAATTDLDVIESWFAPGAPYEGCYVGVIPGDVGKSVVDIDVHDGKANGFETLRDLKLTSSALTSGTSRSGKGLHLWFDGVGTSRPIYPGVDRKSLKGLVRVPYMLPDVEDVFEALPAAFAIHNSLSSGVEYDGNLETWLSKYANLPRSQKTTGALNSVPTPFRGHAEMLRVQVQLVKLAASGHGGVPEVLCELQEAWAKASHSSTGTSAQMEWRRALVGAVTAFGGEPVRVSQLNHPDDFFEKSRLLSHQLAQAISHDLAVGPNNETWVYEEGVWRCKPKEIEKRTVRTLKDRFVNTHIATMQSSVLHGMDLPVLSDSPNIQLINMRNGMFDWSTGEISPHDQQMGSLVQLPIEYDSEATCPRFQAWIDEVIPHDCHELLWEAIGYSLICGNPFHKAILLFGDGGNGKSTLLRVLTSMLGSENISNMTLRAMAEGTFETAELLGKIANIAGDIDARFLADSSTFKAITGQDRILAQKKYGQPFSFTPWAVPIFSGNKTWRSNDDSEGYMRRWIIIPFPNKVDRSREFDESELLRETAGIFNIAMRHLPTLMERHDFAPRGLALEVLNEFKVESDAVRLWLSEDERVTQSESGRCERKTLYGRYSLWCMENGYKAKTSTELFKSLRALGFKESKSGSSRYFNGIEVSDSLVASTFMNF